LLAHLPRGWRFAFDPERGRLWTVCGGCHRWTLALPGERRTALEELERLARDHARPLAHTAHVQLLAAGPLLLVRVGRADRVEQAWWRYGRELRRRHDAFRGPASRVAGVAADAVARVGGLLGLGIGVGAFRWDGPPLAEILRWRRFGRAAWRGRETCPSCRSTLVALRYDLAWWSRPLQGPDGRLGLAVPCPRCDPWTPDKVYRLEGEGAERALRRVLAYQNVAGGGEGAIREAVGRIEAHGSAGAFTREAARTVRSLWRMGRTGRLALEMALSESAEERILEREVQALAAVWRREETLARIVDEELGPEG
jgi:hypothetical protein